MREAEILALSADACALRDATAHAAERVALPADRANWPAAVFGPRAGEPASAGGAATLTQAFTRFGAGAAPFDLLLADSAVKFFVVTPPQGLQRFTELHDLAALRLEELFGTDSAAWRISADWNSRQPFLCCAAANELLAPLEAFAGARLRSAAPNFVRRFNAAAASFGRKPAWFVCSVGGWVSAAYFDAGACHCVRSTALPQPEALARWLGHEALLANRPLGLVHLVTDQEALTIPGANVQRVATSARDLRELQLLAALAPNSPTPVAA